MGNRGSSSRIDIYDLNSGQWSTADLPWPRLSGSSAVFGDEIVFGGGFVSFDHNGVVKADKVDFLNPITMSIRSVCMPGRKYPALEFGQNINTVVVGNQLYYLGDKELSMIKQGESKWIMTFPALDLIALFESGGQLYGVSRNTNPNNLTYAVKMEIFKIQF